MEEQNQQIVTNWQTYRSDEFGFGVLKLNRDYYPPTLAVAVPIPQTHDKFVVFEAYDIYREYGSTSKEGKLLDQILSTFRFLE